MSIDARPAGNFAVSLAERRRALAALAAAAAAVLVMFSGTLLRLVHDWETDDNYSHGFLIPLLSLGAAWYAAVYTAGWPKEGELRIGLTFLGIGCFIHLPAVLLAWPLLDFFALVCVLRGLAVVAGGRAWAGHFLFPTLFLFFMFPLPISWTAAAAVWLQDVVSVAGNAILNLFVVCYQRGNTLQIAGVGEPLIVASECSGLRQIVAFVALAAFLGHCYNKPPLFRALLLLAALPVAIMANVFRVVIMGIGAYNFGTEWLHGWLHHAPALFTLALGLALFLFVGWLLGRLWPEESQEGASCA